MFVMAMSCSQLHCIWLLVTTALALYNCCYNTVLMSMQKIKGKYLTVTGASLVYEIKVRFSRDFYEMILVGKFPSREISEKCASHRSQTTDIQSFLPFHCTQRNVQILAVVLLSAAETCRRRRQQWRGGDAGISLRHYLCNSELCCNN